VVKAAKIKKRTKLGLALSGGGACGAYEVGVVKALARLGLEPQVIAGSSIGALNGAVLASCRINIAAVQLEKIWGDLCPEKVLQPWPQLKKRDSSPLSQWLRRKDSGNYSVGTSGKYREFTLFDDGPLDSILSSALNLKRLYKGKCFYVSVFPASQGLTGAFSDLFHWLFSSRKSEFFHVQSLPQEKVLTILKASAAIPLAFPSQEINGRVYRDGCLGGRNTAQGSIPVQPLLDAGCTHIITVILDHDTRLKSLARPEIKMVEIRPSKPILRLGSIKSIFDFSPQRIRNLITMGEKDALTNNELSKLKKELHPFKSRWDRLKEIL
jgi:NTE family protein